MQVCAPLHLTAKQSLSLGAFLTPSTHTFFNSPPQDLETFFLITTRSLHSQCCSSSLILDSSRPDQGLLGSHSPFKSPHLISPDSTYFSSKFLGLSGFLTVSYRYVLLPSLTAQEGLVSSAAQCMARHPSKSNTEGCGIWGLTVVKRRRELNLSSQAAAAFRKASCRRISCSTSSTLLPSSRLCRSGSWAVSQASATTAS